MHRVKRSKSISLQTQGGYTLQGDFVGAAAQSPGLIFAHGLGSTRQGEKAQALAAECERRGWAFASFDFHAHGESGGTMRDLRGSQLLEDLEAITRYVAAQGHEAIYLVGSSMGGWAAAWFATLYPQRVAACALIAPAFRFLEGVWLTEVEREEGRRTGRFRLTNQWIDLELDYGLYAEADWYPLAQLTERFQTPSLILHGMRDEIVPYTNSLEFIVQCRAAEVQLLLFKNGDHRLNMQKEALAQTACNFLAGAH